MDPSVKLTKIEPCPHQQRAISDRRLPTRYAVTVNGRKIGEVGTHSSESWAVSGRIRTRKLGYTRTWRAWQADGIRQVGYDRWSREDAVATLLEHMADR